MNENQPNPEIQNTTTEQEAPAQKSFFNSWKVVLLLGIVNIIRGALGGALGPVFLGIGILCIGYATYNYSQE